MSMYRKFMRKDEFTRDMFCRSNCSSCMVEVTSEWGKEYVYKIHDHLGQNLILSRSNMDFCMAEINSEGVNESV